MNNIFDNVNDESCTYYLARNIIYTQYYYQHMHCNFIWLYIYSYPQDMVNTNLFNGLIENRLIIKSQKYEYVWQKCINAHSPIEHCFTSHCDLVLSVSWTYANGAVPSAAI